MVSAVRMGQYVAVFPRTALVTGAASGIGAATVDLLRREGAEVRPLDLVDGFDVADPQGWESVGPVDLACLNAGATTGERDIQAVTDEAYRRIVGANLDGVVFGVRHLARVLERGSAIVVTASLAGLAAAADDAIYTATKHAAVGFVRAVALQLEALEIRINAVAPGFADTPILGAGRERFLEAGFPLLRAEEVASAILEAGRSGETGQVWVVQPLSLIHI